MQGGWQGAIGGPEKYNLLKLYLAAEVVLSE
jgi:hypothetical protein